MVQTTAREVLTRLATGKALLALHLSDVAHKASLFPAARKWTSTSQAIAREREEDKEATEDCRNESRFGPEPILQICAVPVPQ